MAAIDVRVPRPGTAKDSREWENYLNDLYERTGAEVDKVDAAMSDNAALQDAIADAQADADAAQASANTAIADAATAQTAADAAQVDADTAITSAVTALAAANSVWVSGYIDDIAAITASGRVCMVAPCAGTITKIYVTINDVTSGGDASVVMSINGVGITSGNVTVPDASAAGDIFSSTPSALNTVAEGDLILAVSNGGGSSTCKAQVLMKITRI